MIINSTIFDNTGHENKLLLKKPSKKTPITNNITLNLINNPFIYQSTE